MSTTLSSPVTALAQLHIATSRPTPATARVTVVGEVDLATVAALRERLLGVLHDQHPEVLEVDLADVTFLDCTGIGALVAARDAAVRAGGQLWVTRPQPFVRRVLDLTGLLGILIPPIDGPKPLPQRPRSPSWTDPAPAIVPERPGVGVAA